MPVLVVGLLTCLFLEQVSWFSYGVELRPGVRDILQEFDRHTSERRTSKEKAALIVQALAALFLVVALANNLAEVGIIGLAVIVLATAFTGVTEEHRIGHAFQEALPFTALLVVFFGIVAVIHDQDLFTPVIDWVLNLEADVQTAAFYLANGALSMISDNVFVATVNWSNCCRVISPSSNASLTSDM